VIFLFVIVDLNPYFSYFATATGETCSGGMCMFGWWLISAQIKYHWHSQIFVNYGQK
jgi:hypothetical protein